MSQSAFIFWRGLENMMAGGASSSAPEQRFGGVVGDQSLLTASDRGVTSPELGRHRAALLTAIFPCIYLW